MHYEIIHILAVVSPDISVYFEHAVRSTAGSWNPTAGTVFNQQQESLLAPSKAPCRPLGAVPPLFMGGPATVYQPKEG
jgi:hypothetical protein